MVKNMIRPSMLSLKIVHDLFINKKGTTIKGLADNLKVDYRNTHDAVNKLVKIGVIKKEKIGNYNVCKLNYDNEDVIEYLKEYNFYIKIREFKAKYPVEYSVIMDTIKRIIHGELANELLVCLLFGSYAKNEGKKGSDLDILFISRVEGNVGCKKELNTSNKPYQKKFHVIEQGMLSFIKDLKNKDKLSLAVEIYKEFPIVFYGDDIFFQIMIEANKW